MSQILRIRGEFLIDLIAELKRKGVKLEDSIVEIRMRRTTKYLEKMVIEIKHGSGYIEYLEIDERWPNYEE